VASAQVSVAQKATVEVVSRVINNFKTLEAHPGDQLFLGPQLQRSGTFGAAVKTGVWNGVIVGS
jgi:hypothetical protein